MSVAQASTFAHPHTTAWNSAARPSGRHGSGFLAVLTVHCLALWAVLSGHVPTAFPTLPSPIVATIVPPAELPKPKPTEPSSKATPKQASEMKSVVPMPEVPTEPIEAAVVIEAQPLPTAPLKIEIPSSLSQAPANPKPIGFGAVSNREACLAAFRDSFPREARRAQQEGIVSIAARISAGGRLLSAEVIHSNPRRVFDRAALAVLNAGACTFEPSTTEYAWQGEISYRLQGESAD